MPRAPTSERDLPLTSGKAHGDLAFGIAGSVPGLVDHYTACLPLERPCSRRHRQACDQMHAHSPDTRAADLGPGTPSSRAPAGTRLRADSARRIEASPVVTVMRHRPLPGSAPALLRTEPRGRPRDFLPIAGRGLVWCRGAAVVWW